MKDKANPTGRKHPTGWFVVTSRSDCNDPLVFVENRGFPFSTKKDAIKCVNQGFRETLDYFDIDRKGGDCTRVIKKRDSYLIEARIFNALTRKDDCLLIRQRVVRL